MIAPAPKRIALVLGGGGLKGFAHVGVLRALQERGMHPAVYAGTSIGALVAAACVRGVSSDEMARRALSLRRRDLFRLNHMGIVLDRMRSPSIYMEEPLRALANAVCPTGTFEELSTPVYVNTVDVERGTQIVWGRPGLTNVSVADAVYASCALPGFFPPGAVGGRTCVDGGVVDNLPVTIASLDVDAVIAVDVGNSGGLDHAAGIATEGFASIYMRAATVMMHALQTFPLEGWRGPPMMLVRPRISHIGWFDFTHTEELLAEGYRAAASALDHLDACLAAPTGVFPRQAIRISVDESKCTGCGICVAHAPHTMALAEDGKAYVRTPLVEWSPADGNFVRQCPTNAIQALHVGTAARTLPVIGD
ncbi:MAG TPA: patatin-like phospholipase family protein [Gemmatimonadaceae bacterium]|nr:patatin-like phospholipase family protein [Gemmatimonadaceae bacterium]